MNPKSTVEKPRVPDAKKLSKKSPEPRPLPRPAPAPFDPQTSQHTYVTFPFSLTIPSG